ncbi:DUF4040 domain-containing protein [Planctomycetota bacterium]|nr:DUF4040 domain-containing protein [Planctomycetota bacterium]
MTLQLVIDISLLALVVVTAVAVVRLRNLFAATIVLGIYSLLMAVTWVNMNAMDVAFTEAAVGAGISSILLIAALLHTGSKEKSAADTPRARVNWEALLTVLLTGAALIYGTLDMHGVGDPQAPVQTGVAKHYVDNGYDETHSPNMVTSVLASYRGFDTMFETAVIFTAGLGMILLLRKPDTATLPGPANAERFGLDPPNSDTHQSSRTTRAKAPPPLGADPQPMSEQVVLRRVSTLLMPFIVVFGIYVITHGEIGAGGGFQGGVIVASAFILYALVFGLPKAQAHVPRSLSDALGAIGVLIYAGVGVVCMLRGHEFLGYNALGSDAPHAQALGMTLVELGVGVTVAAVMITIFSEIAEEA